ncbi:response regulator receiver domain [Algoriphagus halophilus]|uniref:response regulator receiver domain n=1 Tax=Algoriphagus halophilus TaxID=226505 RepID=UPI00359021C4
MAETLTYKIVSEKILEDSISSALFIDDKALESFKSKNYNPAFIDDHNRTLKLYEDFKSKNCLLHSFKFTKSGWKKNMEFYLKNKDLLILDWQLEKITMIKLYKYWMKRSKEKVYTSHVFIVKKMQRI